MTANASKLKSIAEWDALLARYPVGSRQDLFRQAIVVLTGNVVTLYLLVQGRLQPLELVVLVALEAVLLTTVAWLQSRAVPASALMANPMPLRERLLTGAFAVVWLGFVYGLIFVALLQSGSQLAAAARNPLASLGRSDLLWPLAITAVGVVLDSVRDWQHWRAQGGFFLSTPGFNAAARWLTLFLGGLPFFVPMVVVVWALKTIVDRVVGRRTGTAGGPRPEVAVVVMAVLSLCVFGVMGWLIEGGTSGWAIGYCSAKLVSEAFISFLPVIASKARAEEVAALDAG